ncbi:MAG: Ig-like domain-containing protein [Flavobacteriaceae bacterium]|uniref:Ig-like domain-containing protein n=1 Tax=Flagellimonas TaxID=444459 RepID=UPI003BAC9E35|nr:Ig-like domain-containing protein [Flavobacteriaceae bacterium]
MNRYLLCALSGLMLFLVISCSSDSEDPTPELDVTAPTANFNIAGTSSGSSTEPVVVSNQIQININAQDAGGIAKVEAFIDDQKVGEDTTAPYQITIDISGYASKNSLTGKFTDYVLKVTVTDTSGNKTSKEQVINIDNELPTISEVSLIQGTIINGDTNTVTFNITENEGLNGVKVYLDNALLSEITDANYEVNINTLNLSDGENTLKIEAIDLAENLAIHEVVFISDNTGPEIAIMNPGANEILDEPFLFAPQVQDAFSEVVSFVAKLNDETILDSSINETWEILLNPDLFPVGEANFELVATDAVGNETTLNFTNQILRKLFEVQMENGFFENSWFGFHILISEMDGSFIMLETVEITDTELVIYAPDEFAVDKEYMVSFIAEENQSSWVKTHMTIVQNLTRSNFTHINFTAALGESLNQQTIPMSGFFGVESVISRGNGFQTTQHDPNLEELGLASYEGNGYNPYENYYLIGYHMGEDPSFYGYLKIDNPWDPDFVINRSDFSFDDINQGTTTFSGNSLPGYNHNLNIWGFEKAEDVGNKLPHLIYDSNITFSPEGSDNYYYPTVFEKYQHRFKLNNYNTYRDGLPATEYLLPDWTIEHNQNGNEVNITKTGTGHNVGRLMVEIGSEGQGSQLMPVLFDSSKDGPIYLPILPEELSSLNVYSIFENQTYSVEYSELISFDIISTYSDYLNKVISEYKEHTEVSPIMESITNQDAFIFDNWSFKYQ